MNILELLSQLLDLDVQLWLEDGKLRFSAPSGVMTDELRRRLVERKEEIVEFLASTEAAGTAEALKIPVLPRDGDELPLSFAQQRLWFLDQLEPESSAYNVPGALRLVGRLDVEALEEDLNRVVARHEVMRASFPTVDGQPVQVIEEHLQVPLPVIDISHLPEEERDHELRRLAAAEPRRPFDLGTGPLVRFVLVRVTEEDHALLLNMHHAVSDGWSVGVFFAEMMELTRARLTGAEPRLPELPVQYADFAAWQRRWLQGTMLEAQLAFWREHLAGAPQVLELPGDRPRPPFQTYRGALYRFEVPQRVAEGLQALSRRKGTTLFMTLLTAFDVLLLRITGQEDMVVGSPVAYRNVPEVEGLIGYFASTLLLRARLEGEPSFVEALDRIRENALEAFAHQDVPFEMLVEELQPERDPSRSPLCQVMFVLQNQAMPSLELPGMELEAMRLDPGGAKLDLLLSITELDDGLEGMVEYNTDLFEPETIERFGEHYATLLASIVADPELPVSRLELMPAAERQQVLAVLGQGPQSSPAFTSVPEALEARFRERPAIEAVRFEQQRLTYGELEARTARLADRLIGLGVGPEVVVGVALERSLEMVVALVAVMRSGGAYLPLNPEYPAERLQFMIEESGAALLLTQEHLLDAVPCLGLPRVVVDLDDLAVPEPSAGASRPARALPEPEHLAYVIYTSGSTGQPKGVRVVHANLINLLESMQREPGLDAEDVLVAVTTLSFDISGLELMLPLISGAKLVVASGEVTKDPDRLATLIRDSGATVLQATPATWQMLVALPRPLPGLRALCGGESLPRGLAQALVEHGHELWNVYGPTETTIWSVVHRVENVNGPVPIGRPITGTRVQVVDARGEPSPIGVPGELLIGGAGVARDYLGRPELTAERFVPDPFSAEPGARLYRTGDLVRWRAEGALEYLGRLDDQVKLRGFRIELGEIEAVLRSHPAVREAVVACRRLGEHDERLIAYVVPHSGGEAEPLSKAALREHAGTRLPDFMVPSLVVWLDALPLTPAGKVDRRSLPAPEQARADGLDAGTARFVAPRTPDEQALAGLVAEVLGIDQVGVDDDFFDLGGHSLLATQLVSRVRASFSIQLPLKALFEEPTVAGLTRRISRAQEENLIDLRGPIRPIPRTGPLPLSFAQQRLWLVDQLDPDSASYNIPGALRIRGRLDLEAVRSDFTEIVRRHEVLRMSFPAVGGTPRVVISDQPRLPIPFIDLSGLPPQAREPELDRLAAAEAQRPFDLAEGPLLRVVVIRLDEEEHVLLANMHHIVSDGWSVGVLFREMMALARARAAAPDDPAAAAACLPELPIQYVDFAAWQRGWLRGDMLADQLDYWRRYLDGAPPVLDLPSDRPRPQVASSRGALHVLVVPREVLDGLEELSRGQGATLFMTLLAAFKVLLARTSGQLDVLVGTPVASRIASELEGLIGYFANTLVLRTRIDPASSFVELLAEVREGTFEAFAHQDVPFEMLVEELHPERDPSHSPLIQVIFALQNFAVPPLDLPGLSFEPMLLDTGAAKLDLMVFASEIDEGLECVLEYSTDLFDAETMQRLGNHLEALLRAVVADPSQPVMSLDMLPLDERRLVVETWSRPQQGASVDPVAAKTALDLLRAQMRAAPEAEAVRFEDRCLSFEQLERLTGRLAGQLVERGVGPEVVVGVSMDRSLEMVVALVAVVAAGGAYLPLNPEYPGDRLSFMIEDSGAELLLTQAHLVEGLPPCDRPRLVVDLETLGAEADATPTPPGAGPEPRGLAYVIYTSGSTGKPKGVGVEHHSLLNLVLAQIELFEVRPTDRVLQFASSSFDAAVSEVWVTLAAGATLVLAPSAALFPGQDLERTLIEQGITAVTLPPSALARQPLSPLEQLRTLVVAGEACPAELARDWAADRRFVNGYGPTETTVCATGYVCRGDERLAPPIGRPVRNVRVLVLDPGGLPVPIGVAGELCIGGAGVARGYLDRPGLTAERFVPDPYATEPGARLYRSGDLVRWRADGQLEFLGRIDNQVKLRGFRIELGEIEAVLRGHPAVREAMVVCRRSADGDGRLVAYLTPHPGATAASLPASALRVHVARQVPEFMVPSAFVVLEELPTTPSGKVDREAPASPEARLQPTSRSLVEPRSPLEQQLAQLMAEVLRFERVGREDDFFDLGGHSLLATQLVSRIRETLDIEMPMRKLFERPTVAGLAESVSELRIAGGDEHDGPIERADRDRPMPLSFAQQRQWFLHQLDPSNPGYNIPDAVRIQGPLDIEGLRLDIQAVVRRHEALATTFASTDDGPVQVIASEPVVELPIIDLGTWPEAEREAEVEAIIVRESHRPFDLAVGPLARFMLVRLDPAEHVLVLVMHHVITDGWSIGVFIREVIELSRARLEGRPAVLPKVELQYADFAVWQQQRLQSRVVERQLDYWKAHLAGAPESIDLPLDRPQPAEPSFDGGIIRFNLSREVADGVRSLSRRAGATPFMTLLAVFDVLLYRYSGQDDLVVGSLIANRTRQELEGIIGFFPNTVALRTDLHGSPSFSELLGRVRDVTLGAYANQEVPFELVVDAIQPHRDAGRPALFQVLFILQNVPMVAPEVPGFELTPVQASNDSAIFDLYLTMFESPNGLQAALHYRADIFEHETVERMVEHLRVILNAIIADPERSIDEIPFMSAIERRRVLRVADPWPRTEASALCMHHLIDEQVRRAPKAVAALADGEELTYGELSQRADRLARRLVARGVGRDEVVGICLERSPEALVAVLGTWRAGAAYVPLDPSLPPSRIALMIDEVAAPLIVTREALRPVVDAALAELASNPDLPVLVLEHDHDHDHDHSDGDGSGDRQEPDASGALVEASPDNLAYVIYTSGSTGRPKGVMVPHRGLVMACHGWLEAYGMLEGPRRHLQMAAFSFDVFVEDLVRTLASGGTLVFCPRERLLEPDRLIELIRDEQVQSFECVPAILRIFMEHVAASGGCPEPLQMIVCGADVWYVDEYRRFRELLGEQVRLINSFGLTETTIDNTWFEGDPPAAWHGRPVPIGRPFVGTTTYVLSRHLEPVPFGVPGELYLGGASVARGYCRRPDMTAERFVPDPFSAEPGARMYRTGDMARLLPDGILDFIGRRDHQVKIRGFRVELGEIETVLADAPGVREVAVLARSGSAGASGAGSSAAPADAAVDAVTRNPLVGYVVMDEGVEADVDRLREHLRRQLPGYMVPHRILVLDEMPRTTSGKLDRRALPEPGVQEAPVVKVESGPRTATEQRLVPIWCEILSRDRISIYDSFFELGGHSLMAAQLRSRLRSRLGVDLDLRRLFDEPTIAGLARIIDESGGVQEVSEGPGLIADAFDEEVI